MSGRSLSRPSLSRTNCALRASQAHLGSKAGAAGIRVIAYGGPGNDDSEQVIELRVATDAASIPNTALIEKLGGDSMNEMLPRFETLRKASLEDLRMDNTPHIFWE